ncbi:MAG: DNRLRE domain-containing protein, partial [Calditrichae bacterium]|nr:DNRLRE domain-containing protein [Calditrichia bacterium]
MQYRHKIGSLSVFYLCLIINLIPAAEPEEIPELRDFHSKTFINPDGSYTTEISAGYMHFRDASGRFRKIDRQFVISQHSNYEYELTSGLYEVFLEKPGRDAVSFKVKMKKGPSVTCRFQGMVLFNDRTGRLTRLGRVKSYRAVVEGPKIKIENILPGISLSYIYTDTKWKEEIWITQRARRRLSNLVGSSLNPGHLYIGFITEVETDSALQVYAAGQKISARAPMALSGFSWNFQGEEVVDFRDRGGRKRFSFPRDFAVSEALRDSGAVANNAVTMIRRFYSTAEGNFMLSLVPLKWLRMQPAGTVIFDPQIEVSSSANDTWIEHDKHTHFGASNILRVGRAANFGWKRSLLKFAVSPTSLPDNARILSATCHLYWYHSWKTASGIYIERPVLLHQMLKEWTENEADWFERRNGIPWSGPGVEFNDADARSVSEDMQVWGTSGFPAWKQYNITGLVNRWVKGNEPNYGIILWAANENDYSNGDEKWIISSNYRDSSKHPRLVINYTLDNLAEFSYSPQGTIDSVKFGQDAVFAKYNYNIRDWVEDISYWDGAGNSLFAVNFTHDYSGNILSQQYSSLAETDLISYGYDPVYQLKSAVSQAYDNHYFDYDPNGNILWKKVNNTLTDYGYNPANPNRLRQVGSRMFRYDRNGNILSDGDMSLNYDYQNQLMHVSGKAEEKYMYNSEGLRIKKSEGLVTSGVVAEKTAWTLEVTSGVNNVYPTAGKSMYRLKVETAPEFTNFSTSDQVVLADGLDIQVAAGSYLEYDIRAAQTSNMRASIQFYYFDPVMGSYG